MEYSSHEGDSPCNNTLSKNSNILMCKQWWKVCFLLNSSQQAQEKYYRQLYGKQRAQNTTQGSNASEDPPSIKTAASTKIQKLKEDTNFKPIRNIYSKLFVKTGAECSHSNLISSEKSSPSGHNQNFFSTANETDLTLGSTSVVSAHNDVGLYDISDLFSRNPNFYDDIRTVSKSNAATGSEYYENVSDYEHVDDAYYDFLQLKRMNPSQLPKKKYSINVYNLENARLRPPDARSQDDTDLPQLPPCSTNYNASLPRNFLSTNFNSDRLSAANRSVKVVDLADSSKGESKITDPSQLLRNLKENLYSIEQQYKDEDQSRSADLEQIPPNSPNLTNLQIDILRNSPLLYEEKPRSRTLDLSRPLSKIYEDPQQALESTRKRESNVGSKRHSKKVNFNLEVNYEKPDYETPNIQGDDVREINGIIRKTTTTSEEPENTTADNIYGSTNGSQISESREDLSDSNITMNLMRIGDYDDVTKFSDDVANRLFPSEGGDYTNPSDIFHCATDSDRELYGYYDTKVSDKLSNGTVPNGEHRHCTETRGGNFSSQGKQLNSAEPGDSVNGDSQNFPSEENIYDTLENVRKVHISLPAFGLYATTNISNLANPGLYLKSTNVDTLSSEYIIPPVRKSFEAFRAFQEGIRGPCAGFCPSLENG